MMNSRTVIRFIVSVPVLSTHSAVAEPRVSITGGRRVNTCFCDIRQAPRARNTVSTTGNSSGRSAIAVAIPASRPPSQFPRVSPYTTTTTTAASTPTIASAVTRRSISRCSGVRSASIVRSAAPILPNSVPVPVSLATAIA